LQKHWPNIKRYSDVREVGKHNLEPVDLICGGFPCQDVSLNGLRLGIDINPEYTKIAEERLKVVQQQMSLLEVK
jgi:site-specific DNA-cytosine methylase